MLDVIDESVVIPWKHWAIIITKHAMNQSSRTIHALYMSPSRRIPCHTSDVQDQEQAGRTDNNAEVCWNLDNQ